RRPGEAVDFLRRRAAMERLRSLATVEWNKAQELRRTANTALLMQLMHDRAAAAAGRQMMPVSDPSTLEMQSRAHFDEANAVLIDLVVGYRELKARLDHEHQAKSKKRRT